MIQSSLQCYAYLVSAHVLMLYTINVRIIESVLCADQSTCNLTRNKRDQLGVTHLWKPVRRLIRIADRVDAIAMSANDWAPNVRYHIHCRQSISLLELFTGMCNSDNYCVVFLEVFIDWNLESVRIVQSGSWHTLYEQTHA